MNKKWGDPGTYLVMWHCGDDVCNCYQVELQTRGPKDQFPCFLLGKKEVSDFHSDPDDDDWKEMKEAWDKAVTELKPDFIQERPSQLEYV